MSALCTEAQDYPASLLGLTPGSKGTAERQKPVRGPRAVSCGNAIVSAFDISVYICTQLVGTSRLHGPLHQGPGSCYNSIMTRTRHLLWGHTVTSPCHPPRPATPLHTLCMLGSKILGKSTGGTHYFCLPALARPQAARYDPVHGNRNPDVPATQLGLPKAIVLEGRSAKM